MFNKLIIRSLNAFLSFLVLVLLTSFLASCKKETVDNGPEIEKRLLEQYIFEKDITTSPLPSGIYFIEKKKGTGNSLSENNWLIWNYTLRLVNGNRVMETSYENVAKANGSYNPNKLYGWSKYLYSAKMVPGLYEGLSLMKEGGQATLIVPSHLGFGSKTQQGIPGYSILVYDIEFKKAIPDIVAYEAEKFNNYVDSLTTYLAYQTKIKTSTGVYYFETQAGTGDTIPTGKTVDILYKGYLTDGRIFDSNLTTGKVLGVKLGEKKVIQGWESVLKVMKLHSKGIAVIPWEQAYGESGNNSIQPYSNLVFEMEVDSIR